MSRRYDLFHYVETYTVGNRRSLNKALRSLSDNDCDFNGDNGVDYLWDKVEGFDSNQDYCIDMIKDIEDEEEAIKTFLSSWLDEDSYYIQWEYIVKIKGRVGFISLTGLT